MIVNENNNNHRNCAERHFYYILFKFSIKNSLKNIFVSEYWIKLLRCLHAKTSNMRRLKRMKRREEETGSISTWCKRSRFSNKLMKPKLADATKYSRMYLYTSTCIGWNWGRKLLTSKRAIRKHTVSPSKSSFDFFTSMETHFTRMTDERAWLSWTKSSIKRNVPNA